MQEPIADQHDQPLPRIERHHTALEDRLPERACGECRPSPVERPQISGLREAERKLDGGHDADETPQEGRGPRSLRLGPSPIVWCKLLRHASSHICSPLIEPEVCVARGAFSHTTRAPAPSELCPDRLAKRV